jgi:NADH-quinone oxidoreductase subunit N
VVNSVVSLFYYARILRTMYFSKAEEREGVTIRPLYGVATLTLVVPTLVFGLYWGPVYDFVARSMILAR